MNFDKGLAKLTLTQLDVSKGDEKRTVALVMQPVDDTSNTYYMVYPANGGYEYYPFIYETDGLTWIKPSSGIVVETLADMRRQTASSKHKKIRFRKATPAGARSIRAKWKAVQEAKKAKSKKKQTSTKPKPSPKPKPAPAPRTQAVPKPKPSPAPKPKSQRQTNLLGTTTTPVTTIDRLDVGGRVYVQGFFSDQLAVILQIHKPTGKVKVRQGTKGDSQWVHHTRIITKSDAVANDIGRTVVGGAVILCLLAPDVCKKKK